MGDSDGGLAKNVTGENVAKRSRNSFWARSSVLITCSCEQDNNDKTVEVKGEVTVESSAAAAAAAVSFIIVIV